MLVRYHFCDNLFEHSKFGFKVFTWENVIVTTKTVRASKNVFVTQKMVWASENLFFTRDLCLNKYFVCDNY